MGQPTSAEIGDSAVSHGPADVGLEIFGPEMYTCPDIFALEMYSRCESGDFTPESGLQTCTSEESLRDDLL
jgi:hypothetical protein